jgi:hypothetical protein
LVRKLGSSLAISERRSRGYDIPNIRLLKMAAIEAAANHHFKGWLG